MTPQSYKRDSLFTALPEFDFFAKEGDFIEVTHWYNGEGFDVMLSTQSGEQRFSLSWGEWRALITLVPAEELELED
jgi:hypothetical protein